VAGCQPSTPTTKTPAQPKGRTAESQNEQQAASQQIVLFAAASTQESIETILDEFQRLHPAVAASTSFASSATLAQQIAEGASANLFLSASRQWVDFLEQKNLIAEVHVLLGNQLVAVVPADSTLAILKPEDLLAGEVEHIALGEPDSVPAGIYAKQALAKLGLWEKLHDKLVPGEDVRHALAMVEAGATDAGIVYATDAAISDKVKIAFPFDSELTEPIEYPLALVKRADENSAARELYRYLQSPAAAAVFRQAGFRVQQATGKQ
jgi:molybdate transport system substrate-binding protein